MGRSRHGASVQTHVLVQEHADSNDEQNGDDRDDALAPGSGGDSTIIVPVLVGVPEIDLSGDHEPKEKPDCQEQVEDGAKFAAGRSAASSLGRPVVVVIRAFLATNLARARLFLAGSA